MDRSLEARTYLHRKVFDANDYSHVVLFSEKNGWSKFHGFIEINALCRDVIWSSNMFQPGSVVFCKFDRNSISPCIQPIFTAIDIAFDPKNEIYTKIMQDTSLLLLNTVDNIEFKINLPVLVCVVSELRCFGYSELVGKVIFNHDFSHLVPGMEVTATVIPKLNGLLKDVGFVVNDYTIRRLHRKTEIIEARFPSVKVINGGVTAKATDFGDLCCLLTLESLNADVFSCVNDFQGSTIDSVNEILKLQPNLTVWLIPSLGHRSKYKAIRVAPWHRRCEDSVKSAGSASRGYGEPPAGMFVSNLNDTSSSLLRTQFSDCAMSSIDSQDHYSDTMDNLQSYSLYCDSLGKIITKEVSTQTCGPELQEITDCVLNLLENDYVRERLIRENSMLMDELCIMLEPNGYSPPYRDRTIHTHLFVDDILSRFTQTEMTAVDDFLMWITSDTELLIQIMSHERFVDLYCDLSRLLA